MLVEMYWQELEKFKWILDYKLKDLKESIKPSRIQAAELTERIGKMENELIRYFSNVLGTD